jgi:hypothetical protein
MTIDESIIILDKIKEDLTPLFIEGDGFNANKWIKENHSRYDCSFEWFKFYTMCAICELHKKYINII